MLTIGWGVDDGVISLLVGEMAGRPEGGGTERSSRDLRQDRLPPLAQMDA